LPVVRDECLDMALQKIGSDRHRSLLVPLWGIRSELKPERADMCARFLMTRVYAAYAVYASLLFTTAIGARKRCWTWVLPTFANLG
jgi:hypothetical protein